MNELKKKPVSRVLLVDRFARINVIGIIELLHSASTCYEIIHRRWWYNASLQIPIALDDNLTTSIRKRLYPIQLQFPDSNSFSGKI